MAGTNVVQSASKHVRASVKHLTEHDVEETLYNDSFIDAYIEKHVDEGSDEDYLMYAISNDATKIGKQLASTSYAYQEAVLRAALTLVLSCKADAYRPKGAL